MKKKYLLTNRSLLFLSILVFLLSFCQARGSESYKFVLVDSKISGNVLVWTLCYLTSGDTVYLNKIIEGNQNKPDKYLGIVDFAEFIVNKKMPSLPFEQARLKFLLENQERLARCLVEKLKSENLISHINNSTKVIEEEWIPTDLYIEGLFKLMRGIPKSEQELSSIIAPLHLRRGESVADIGFADGQLTVAMAKETGLEGRAVGIEISPVLVDFLNYMSRELNLPQLEGKLCGHTDIMFPADTLDAAFIRFVFSNLRDDPQSWVNSIFKAMRPGGRVVILQHYSPAETQKMQESIDRFMNGGVFPVSTEIPCSWRSPALVKQLCVNAGFKVYLLKEEIFPDHVYLLEVRKP